MKVRWWIYRGPRDDLWPPVHLFWNAKPYIGFEVNFGRRVFSITWAPRQLRERGW